MLYREYIQKMKEQWIGKKVTYQGKQYTVVNVDYNGALWIDKPHRYHESYTADHTAVAPSQLDK